MRDWLAFSAHALIAGWILIAGTLALLRLRRRPPRRIDRPAVPAGQGLRALARLLAATASSTYSRDRVQERLRILAEDLFALEQGVEGPGSRRTPEGGLAQKDTLLATYFAEDHVGFKGSRRRKRALDPDFLRRSEEAIRHLEHHGHSQQGDPP